MVKKFDGLSSIASVLLLLSGFALAVYFRGTQDIVYAPMLAALMLAGLTMAAPGRQAGWTIPRTAPAVLMLAWWLYLFASLQWSQTPYISTYFFLVFSIVPFLFFALVIAPEPRKVCERHAAAIVSAIGLLALWCLIQFLFFYAQYGPRIHHPLLNPNNMAGVLNLGLLPALALFMAVRGRRKVILCGSLLAILFAALIVTQSKGGLISMAVAALVMLPFLSRPLKAQTPRLLVTLSILLLTALALWFYGQEIHVRDLSQTLLRFNPHSVSDRAALWGATLHMALDHFWGGTGLASFSYFYPAYRQPTDASDGYFAHMDPLQFWAETGVAAPLIFYALLIAVFVRTIRALHATGTNDTGKRARILGPFCGLLAIVLHTHLTFHLYMPVVLIPVAVLLAFWHRATEDILPTRYVSMGNQRPFVTRAVLVTTLLALSAAGIWAVRASVATRYIAETGAFLSGNDLAAARTAIEKAAFWTPASKAQVPQYQARILGKTLHTKGSQLTTAEKRALFDDAMALLDEAEKRQPSLVYIANDRAQVLYIAQNAGLITDGRERAEQELRAILKKDPLFIESRTGLANIYQSRGELKKALAVLEEGLRWPRPKGQPDINFLVATAQLRLQLGDRAGHDALIATALQHAKAYGLTARP